MSTRFLGIVVEAKSCEFSYARWLCHPTAAGTRWIIGRGVRGGGGGAPVRSGPARETEVLRPDMLLEISLGSKRTETCALALPTRNFVGTAQVRVRAADELPLPAVHCPPVDLEIVRSGKLTAASIDIAYIELLRSTDASVVTSSFRVTATEMLTELTLRGADLGAYTACRCMRGSNVGLKQGVRCEFKLFRGLILVLGRFSLPFRICSSFTNVPSSSSTGSWSTLTAPEALA